MARVLIIRQAHVPLDPRVARELNALLGAGHEVDVLCTRRRGERVIERGPRVRFLRLPLYHRRGGAEGGVARPCRCIPGGAAPWATSASTCCSSSWRSCSRVCFISAVATTS